MIKSTKNAEHYTWGAQCEAWHLLKSESLSVIEERMPPGTSEQLHYHERAQQVFYILSGTATFDIDGKLKTVEANQSIHIPPKTKHFIRNNGKADLHLLVISEPRAHGDRINVAAPPNPPR